MSTSSPSAVKSAKRLLILTDADFVGGAETNYRFILPGLAERGWTATFLAPGAKHLQEYFDQLGLPVSIRPIMRPYWPISLHGRPAPLNLLRTLLAVRANQQIVAREVARLQPDAIVSNSMTSHYLLSRLGDLPVRRVMHLHDIVDRRKAMGRYGRGLDRIARRMDAVITVSNAVTATLPEDQSARAIRLYNPIAPVNEDHPRLADEAHAVKRFGIFARYTPWKGHEDFLRIAEACAEMDATFVSFGNVAPSLEPYFHRLQDKAGALPNAGRVSLRRFAADPLQEMARCDAVLHLSQAPEPFGRVLIEANQCRVPVFAYENGGVGELFDTLGVSGQRFQVGDWKAIAAALKTVDRRAFTYPDLSDLYPGPYAERFAAVLEGKDS